MVGAAGLQGPGLVAAMMRQRLSTVPRTSRSISTFQSQRWRVPCQSGQMNLSFSEKFPWRPACSAVGPAAIRFNSTSSSPTPAPGLESTFSSEVPFADDFSNLDITSIPERIGYLKELGLDYGWGPAAMMQYIIEHLHVWGGLPWWASVVGAGLLIRLALLKPMVDASDTSARLNNAKHIVGPLRNEMIAYGTQSKQLEAQQKRAEIQQVYAERGIKLSKTFIPMIQVPLGYGIFRSVRGMGNLPVPSLSDESFLWLNDLTVADPLYILPVATSFLMYLTFKRGGEAGLNDMFNGAVGKVILLGLPLISFSFMLFQPSLLQLYFMSTGLLALCQSYVINDPNFRQWMGMEIPNHVLERGPVNTETIRLTRQLEEERNRALNASKQPPATEDPNISMIDRQINRVKSFGKNATKEAADKIRQFQGQDPGMNADGTPAAPPRHTAAELKAAESYEAQERERAAFAREQRNLARQEAYKAALMAERQKAQASWQKQQETARSKQNRPRK